MYKQPLILIYGELGTGKTIAMKALLGQLKAKAEAEGEAIEIVSNIYCCFADRSWRFNGNLETDIPEDALIGLDDLDKLRNPTSLVRALVKRDNLVVATSRTVEQFSRELHRLTAAYVKPRMLHDQDALVLDNTKVIPDALGLLPSHFVKQTMPIKHISRLFCACPYSMGSLANEKV